MKVDRSHQIQPPVPANTNASAKVVRRVSCADPRRVDRVAEILLDIIETANRLDSKPTPVKDGRP